MLPVQRVATRAARSLGRRVSVVRTDVTSRADLNWHFYMVNTNDFNAFALPGGYIYVNRGVAERSDKMDQFASVIAHEIGHEILLG